MDEWIGTGSSGRRSSGRHRTARLALAFTMTVVVASSATVALVTAATSGTLLKGGQLGALAFYSNNFATDLGPMAVAFDGTNVWVTSRDSNKVKKFNATTNALVGTYNTGMLPSEILFDGTNIWIVNFGSNNLTKLLASNGSVVGTYAVPGTPRGITFDGTNIFVGVTTGTKGIYKYLAATGAQVGMGPWTQLDAMSSWTIGALAFDGRYVWAVNDDGSKYFRCPSNVSTPSCLGTMTGVLSMGVAVAFDGANVWVAFATPGGVVKKVSTTDGSVVATYPIQAPLGIVFDQAGYSTSANRNWDPRSYIWVTSENNTITQLDALTGAVVSVHPTAAAPRQPGFDGSNIWIPNYGSNTLTKLAVR